MRFALQIERFAGPFETIMAKRKYIPKPGWSQAIRSLMLASRSVRTQTALSKKSGVAQSTIGRILRGEVNPQSENLERLAMAFGMSYSTLAAIAEGEHPIDATQETPVHTRRCVPLINVTQLRALSESTPIDSSEWIEFPKKKQGQRTVALKVSGESMEPDYTHGDIIYIDPDAIPLHGKYVIARFTDRNEVTFKRLVVESDQRYLKPLNPNWPDKFISMSADALILGVVVGKYTDK